MSNRISYLNRRMFLKGAGKLALAIPTLPSLLPRSAQAQVEIKPRFIGMSSQNGAAQSADWFPAQLPTTNRTLLFPAATNPHHSYYNTPNHFIHMAPLAPGPEGLSPYFDSRFNSFARKMNFIKGLDFRYSPDGNHVGGPLLGNILASTSNLDTICKPFPTIDQVMAYSSNFYPNGGAGYVRSVQIDLNNVGSGMSWNFQNPIARSGPIVNSPAIANPKILFDLLFPPGSGGGGGAESPTPYIDAVLENFKRVQNGRAIGRVDKNLLQAHIDLFADLERNLNATVGTAPFPSCVSPTAPASSGRISWGQDEPTIRNLYHLMNSLLVLAMSCQRTRVASYYIHTVPGFEGLGGSSLEDGKWHWASHNISSATLEDKNTSQQYLSTIYKWISNNVLYDLIVKMEQITEANGKTLLDNSLLQYSSASLDTAHAHRNMPVLLFGSAGSRLNSGLYVDYQNRDYHLAAKPGILFNHYLVTAMEAIGLSPADYSMTSLGLLGDRYPNGALGYGEYWPTPPPGQTLDRTLAWYKGSTANPAMKLPFL